MSHQVVGGGRFGQAQLVQGGLEIRGTT